MVRRHFKILCMALFISFFTISATGCAGVSYRFGGAPAVLSVRDPVEKCIRERRIVVRPAYANFRTSENIGGGPNVTVTLVTTHKHKGYTFYMGRKRLTAEQVLKVLNHRDLQAAYEGLYKESLRKGRSQVTAGWWLVGSGIAASVAGGGVILGSLKGDDLNDTMLWTGVGILTAATVATLIGTLILSTGIKKKNTGEVFKTIFMSGDLQPDLKKAIENYNRTILAQCQR